MEFSGQSPLRQGKLEDAVPPHRMSAAFLMQFSNRASLLPRIALIELQKLKLLRERQIPSQALPRLYQRAVFPQQIPRLLPQRYMFDPIVQKPPRQGPSYEELFAALPPDVRQDLQKDKSDQENLSATQDGSLHRLAVRAMRSIGFGTAFSPQVESELSRIEKPAACEAQKDLRDKLWFSIDNEDSRDLDQVTYVEEKKDGFKVFVGIADVEALVPIGSAIDGHAQHNTTSLYMPGEIFSMLPEKLSAHLSSLNVGEDRLAVVVEMDMRADGEIARFDIYSASLRNHAKLAYDSVGNWLEGKGPPPAALAQNDALRQQLIMHQKVAESLHSYRQQKGMVHFETMESQIVFDSQGHPSEIVPLFQNSAHRIIEHFMVAANECVAKFLKQNNLPVLQRVMGAPKNWSGIRALAKKHLFELPEKPDSQSLGLFLSEMQKLDPGHFPDLSLAVIKMLGCAKYQVGPVAGHFALGVESYCHFTAPNRRYSDLVNQRLLKALLAQKPIPYSIRTLEEVAAHCTYRQMIAKRVMRKMRSSEKALLLTDRMGAIFDGCIIEMGQWIKVQIFSPQVLGKMKNDNTPLTVGSWVKVQLFVCQYRKGTDQF